MTEQVDRRKFLKGVGVGVGGVAAAGLPQAALTVTQAAAQTASPVSPTAPSTAGAPTASAAAAERPGYIFLTPPEAAFIEAAVDILIPADDLSPSGTDCGVATFIDRQLAGAWGKGDRLYMQGPWRKGVPTQGYQSPLAPAEYYRAALAAATQHCMKTYGKEFDRLTVAQRTEVLQGMDQSKITFSDGLSAKEFFEIFLANVMEGFFADPIYSGNKDKVAWKMIGYPGVIATHAENIVNYRNKRYVVEPTSIADLS